MRLHRLPIAVAPAQHETVASYLARLANLHGLPLRELWEPISVPRPGSRRRDVLADRLAAVTGHDRVHLMRALPELHPAPDWSALQHQPQRGCPRCDARHPGDAVTRILAHHHYVCTRHRYWIGPPDIDQPATALGPLDDIVGAQRHHLRLLRRHGAGAAYDAVLTGFLFCGHLWADRCQDSIGVQREWTRRAAVLIPLGAEPATFSASRLFAAVYPEAVSLASLIASPTWRLRAAGDADQQRQFTTEVGHRLGRPHYYPAAGHDDAVAHWMMFDCWRPPSPPDRTFPDTREHGSIHPPKVSENSRDRHHRSAFWFAHTRRGGGAILHHRHIRPVLSRDWSPKMDGIAATIWASQTTSSTWPRGQTRT
jgi:hypothetical protein